MHKLINDKFVFMSKFFILILLSLLVFPVFILLSIIFDSVFGDSFVVLSALYDSKSALLNEFVTAWIYSTPYCAFLVCGMYFVIYLIASRDWFNMFWNTVLVGAIPGAILGTWLYYDNLFGMITFVFVSIMLSISLKRLFSNLKEK